VASLFTFGSRTNDPTLSFFARSATVPAGDVEVNATWDAAGTLLSATLGGATATVNGNLITADSESSWAGLRILFRNPGSGAGSRSSTISLSHGIGAALTRSLTRLTDSSTGLVQYQTAHLESSVKGLTDDIENMTTRLATRREILTAQYAAMERTVAGLQNQSSALSASFR
jgi:flagellar capping protein FliD